MTKIKNIKMYGKRSMALLLLLALIISMLPSPAMAAQEDNYHDPAEHWLTASSRTNELDANAVVTQETFYCGECRQALLLPHGERRNIPKTVQPQCGEISNIRTVLALTAKQAA